MTTHLKPSGGASLKESIPHLLGPHRLASFTPVLCRVTNELLLVSERDPEHALLSAKPKQSERHLAKADCVDSYHRFGWHLLVGATC